MKNLWIGTPASLNRKWRELRQERSCVWFGDNLSTSIDSSTAFPQTSWKWSSFCLKILRDAYGDIGRLLERDEIDSVIRTALRDPRCSGRSEFQNLANRPGSVAMLARKLRDTASQVHAAEESKEFFQDKALDLLRTVYQEKLAESKAIDAPGLFLRFMESYGSPELTQALSNWHQDLTEKLGHNYSLAVPRADLLTEDDEKLTKAIAYLILDGFKAYDFGIAFWPDDSTERYLKVVEDWTAMGLETNSIPVQPETLESYFLEDPATPNAAIPENLRFVMAKDIRTELQSVTDYVSKLVEGFGPESVLIHTPQQGLYVDQLRESLARAGIGVAGLFVPLIERPLVRTVLDVAAAMENDWPTESLADLLRHPHFQGDSLALADSTYNLERLAQDVDRLGNINGLGTIRQLMLTRHEERQKLRREKPEPAYTLYASSLLNQLAEITAKPLKTRTWAESVEHLKSLTGLLFKPAFCDDDSIQEFWKSLENSVGAAVPNDSSPWLWNSFHREAHMRAELKIVAKPEPLETKVRLTSGSQLKTDDAQHLVLAGMTEGQFPSKAKIRKALQKNIDVSLKDLEANERRNFRSVVGAGSESLWISHYQRDHRGVDTEACGFLRNQKWARPEPSITSIPSVNKVLSEQVSRSLQVSASRQGRESGPFQGTIQSPAVLESLLQKFGPGYTFSPTSLESASLCPFQFFGKYVLGLGEDDTDDDLGTDFMAEGEAIHSILEELHKVHRQPHELLQDEPEFESKIHRLIDSKHPCPPDLIDSAFGRARWEVEHRRIEHRLAAYTSQVAKDLSPPSSNARGNGKINASTEFSDDLTVLHCEIRAGGSTQVLKPLELEESQTGMSFRVGGRIDRIDGELVGPVARVRLLDYKTGNPIPEKKIQKKLHLQLPLYAIMLHGRSIGNSTYEVVDIGFWYLKRSKSGYSSIRAWLFDKDPLNLTILKNDYLPFIQSLVGRIRAGHFPVKPREFGCEKNCPISEVCRIREIHNLRDRNTLVQINS